MIQRDVPMIEARNISHWYPGTGHLFEDLTFRLRGGEVAAVVGPSGSGKSTLLSILEGWERPRSGEIRRNGVARSGWVFQNPHGMARRTALDHVTLSATDPRAELGCCGVTSARYPRSIPVDRECRKAVRRTIWR